MGLKLDRLSLSREGFLIIGVTMDSLKQDGKQPVYKERFMMFVMVGARIGRHAFRREVGSGSSSHCLSGRRRMRLEISSTETEWNKQSLGGFAGGGSWCSED
jgi:hypothetical protein